MKYTRLNKQATITGNISNLLDQPTSKENAQDLLFNLTQYGSLLSFDEKEFVKQAVKQKATEAMRISFGDGVGYSTYMDCLVYL